MMGKLLYLFIIIAFFGCSFSVLADITESGDVNILETSSTTGTVTVASGAPDFLSGWSYRKLHAIGGSADGDLTNYQMRFVVWNTAGTDSGGNVYLNGKGKSDFSDLRFTTVSGSLMPYWIESSNSSAAVVWVKIPTIPRGGTQIYLYYGNTSATTNSNPSNVMEYYDGFEDGVSNWTVDSGPTFVAQTSVVFAGEKAAQYTHGSTTTMSGAYYLLDTHSTGVLEYQMRPAQTTKYVYGNLLIGTASAINGTWSCFTSSGQIAAAGFGNIMPYQANQWYKIALQFKGDGTYGIFVNDVFKGNATTIKSSTIFDRIAIHGYDSAGVVYADEIFFHEYTKNLPFSSSWGSQEQNPIPPVSGFNYTQKNPLSDKTIQFNDTTQNSPDSWSWDFGDGGSSTLQNVAHTYAAAGTYTVNLTTTNAYGSSSTEKTVLVQTLDNWSYVKSHTITGSSSTVTDYQMRIHVLRSTGTDSGEACYLGTNVKSDYSDLLFTSSDGNTLLFWIENSTEQEAYAWVKIPSIPTTGYTLKVYYGNSQTPTFEAEPSDVMEYYEGFEDGVSNWTVDSGPAFVAQTSVKFAGEKAAQYTHGSTTTMAGAYHLLNTHSTGVLEYRMRPAQTTKYVYGNLLIGTASAINGTWSCFTSSGQIAAAGFGNIMSYQANQWYKIALQFKGDGTYGIFVNDVFKGNATTIKSSTIFDRIAIHGYDSAGVVYADEVFLHKYVTNPPGNGGWI